MLEVLQISNHKKDAATLNKNRSLDLLAKFAEERDFHNLIPRGG